LTGSLPACKALPSGRTPDLWSGSFTSCQSAGGYLRLTPFGHHDIVAKETGRYNLTQFGGRAMSKSRDTKKDVKKKPSKTAKEKKKAKREKKNE